jgi:hypothetical protein
MGLKDWFGGDKKKAAYRDKVKEAVSDGKLSERDTAELEAMRKELDVAGLDDEKTRMRRDLYNEAVGAVKKGGKLTQAEAAELARIQKFLALRDDQVEKTKWDLARLRTLTEIRQGNLPSVSAANPVLRGLQLEPGEMAHYSVQAELLDLEGSEGAARGVPVQWSAAYVQGSARDQELPATGARVVGQGALVVTNRRVIFRGEGRTAAIRMARDVEMFLYGDGLRIKRTVGSTLIRFRSGTRDTAEIVGELLAAVMR